LAVENGKFVEHFFHFQLTFKIANILLSIENTRNEYKLFKTDDNEKPINGNLFHTAYRFPPIIGNPPSTKIVVQLYSVFSG